MAIKRVAGASLVCELPMSSSHRGSPCPTDIDRKGVEMLTEVPPEAEAGKPALLGRCQCGIVRYRVEDAFVYASNCNCSNCRAATGSAFKPFAGIEREKLGSSDGGDRLLIVGDDGLNDTRCGACGSLLFSVVRDGEYVHVALGSLVDEPSMRPTKHIFVGSKAPWFEITDDLPQFEEHATQLSAEEAAARSLTKVSAISLFVEDLQEAKSFYRDVFDVDVVFEDDTSVCVKFGRLFVNLLLISAAQEQVEPGAVASRDSGSRFQLSIWVDDVDAVCALLEKRGVKLLTGPTDRVWSMRTATFTDPDGHSWELAQELSRSEDS
jgi:catechol 2,3-dioxygenase-like lactoylglutathione lyase family enzyme